MVGDSWPSLLLHNRGNQNHWLEVAFRTGPGTNRLGIGTKVWVSAGGKTYVQELWSGSRFGAANSLRLHFGLGAAATVDKLEVRWPNAKLKRTVLTGLAADQAIEVSEAEGTSRQLWVAERPPAPTGNAGGAR